jgi:glycosyltransferase involved in cell wall biosynthesis
VVTESTAGRGEDRPLLSILIPAYNVAEFLDECLTSIWQQNASFQFEILVLDDCSSDQTRAVAERWNKRHGECLTVILHERNRGISAARNRLLTEAQGQYVWFVDPDDYLLPGSLERFGQIAQQHGPDMILFDFRRDDRPLVKGFDGMPEILITDREQLVRGVFTTRKMFCWARISKRALWDHCRRFPEGRFFEDIATTPWLLLQAESSYYVPKCWVHYRQRQDSILWRFRYMKEFDENVNDSFADALSGYLPDLAKTIGGTSDATRYAIAHFQAKVFTQIGFNLFKSRMTWTNPSRLFQMLAKYRGMTESASPFTFGQLRHHYLKRRNWEAFAALVLIGAASSISRPA